MAKVGRFRGFELKTAISVSVRFLTLSGRHRQQQLLTIPRRTFPHGSIPRCSVPHRTFQCHRARSTPAAVALKRSVRQFSNYSSAQVIFKGGVGAPNPAE